MNMIEKKGIMNKIKYSEILMWTIMGCFNKYCMSFEPDCLNNSFRKFYLKASCMTPNDVELCNIWAEMVKNGKI